MYLRLPDIPGTLQQHQSPSCVTAARCTAAAAVVEPRLKVLILL